MSQILLGLVQALMNVASSDSGHQGPLPLGYLVIGIIWAPALVLFIAALVGKPRGKKIKTVY